MSAPHTFLHEKTHDSLIQRWPRKKGKRARKQPGDWREFIAQIKKQHHQHLHLKISEG